MEFRFSHLGAAILLFAAAAARAEGCDYATNPRCIKAEAGGSATLPLAPLFATPPTFVFADDDLSKPDRTYFWGRSSYPLRAEPDDPVQAAGFWLEYAPAAAPAPEPARGLSYGVAAFSTAGATAGALGAGADGACAGLLGGACVRGLREVLVWAVLARGAPNALGLRPLTERKLANLSCPADLFSDPPFTLAGNGLFAREWKTPAGDWSRPPLPSGNASYVHSGIKLLGPRTLKMQEERVVVAATFVYPAALDITSGAAKASYKDVTVEFACLRIGGGDGSDGKNKDNVAGLRLGLDYGVVIASVATVVASLLLM